MSAMKRMLEDIAALVHEGNRDKIEAMLEGWEDCQKVALLMEAISLNRLICSGYCPCDEGGTE
jgi:hypothetical protein